jgi:uncharacterized protein GlcG (DUF336 family)
MSRVLLRLSVLSIVIFAAPSYARAGISDCDCLPSAADLKNLLRNAPGSGGEAGGLFHGTRMWGAVVNRNGEICASAVSTDDPTQVWPGSQAIAKSKAYTANAFSVDVLPLSTARLYTFTQPGHSLWSLGQSNPFNPRFLAPPIEAAEASKKIEGGLIFFGGGVPLYKNGKIIGGLGVKWRYIMHGSLPRPSIFESGGCFY